MRLNQVSESGFSPGRCGSGCRGLSSKRMQDAAERCDADAAKDESDHPAQTGMRVFDHIQCNDRKQCEREQEQCDSGFHGNPSKPVISAQ